MESAVTIVEIVTTVLALVVAAVQTVRYKHSQSLIKDLKRAKNATIWTHIAIVLEAYYTIEDARDKCEKDQEKGEVFAKITSARRTIVILWLDMLKEAALDEEEYNLKTIEKWIKLGRLENDWRIDKAKRLVPTINV